MEANSSGLMLVKCETKSHRVKGLSFHPKLTWVLASLHNGIIQLWDYRIGTLVDKFEEHEGPVRGVDFHRTQPLFVSGGDDYRIKVWNYRDRRCIFTLLGHLDYIRTVQFHHEYPWILSSSDDQTIRIWNWQSRNCIAVLTGHNHYVMCAQFHPVNDLIASCSLDQSIRIWDISGLREKTVSSSGNFTSSGSMATDVFGTSDAICKHVLEGHERGINWVTFHSTLPLLASAADDRTIRLWRYNDSKAWEIDALRGHFNNVSCILFHPTHDWLISNSEDRTVRVWDVSKRVVIHTFRRDSDRFWVIIRHPISNLFAVGHDSGMVVFKLERERPVADCTGNDVWFVKDKYLHLQQLTNDSSISITAVRKGSSPLSIGPRRILLNPFSSNEISIAIIYDGDSNSIGGIVFDLITLSSSQYHANEKNIQTHSNFAAYSVAFIARNRIAVLSSPGMLHINSLDCEICKRIELPIQAESIFTAGLNRLILSVDENIYLFDISSRSVIAELNISGGVKNIIWSSSGSYFAILSKHNVSIVNCEFECLCTLHESIRVKSGLWERNVFIFSTLSHVKYVLPEGDSGILYSVLDPIYLLKATKNAICYIDRNFNIVKKRVNMSEISLKLAINNKDMNSVESSIKEGNLCGNYTIGYLTRKGFPDVAMQFVRESNVRFNIAVECGDINAALEAAQNLENDKVMWQRLGVAALNQGNVTIVEKVYQKTKNFDGLAFLYFITGNMTKLRKMLKISEMRKDSVSQFNNALLLGDVEERVRILTATGQIPLALLTAKAHNLTDMVASLEEKAENIDVDSVLNDKRKLLVPPIPIFRAYKDNTMEWPKITKKKTINLDLKDSNVAPVVMPMKSDEFCDKSNCEEQTYSVDVQAGEEWDLDIDVPLDSNQLEPDKYDVDTTDHMAIGTSIYKRCLVNSNSAVSDLIASGDFDTAISVLRKRIAVINFSVLLPFFKDIYLSSKISIPILPFYPNLSAPLLTNNDVLVDPSAKLQLMRLYDCAKVMEALKEAHSLVTGGKFKEALDSFRNVLYMLVFVIAENKEEEAKLNEILEVCRNYILAMRLEVTRLSTEDAKRGVELIAYFTCCDLQPLHLSLVLRRAMGVAWKTQNYITAASFARRLLRGNFVSHGQKEEVEKTKKILVMCEQKATDAYPVDFDPSDCDKLLVCSQSLTKILPQDETIRCPFCQSITKAALKGDLCESCQLSQLGSSVLGIHFAPIANA